MIESTAVQVECVFYVTCSSINGFVLVLDTLILAL
jgi:hypothetical protein